MRVTRPPVRHAIAGCSQRGSTSAPCPVGGAFAAHGVLARAGRELLTQGADGVADLAGGGRDAIAAALR
jgi:hypothetical protein